MTIKIILLLITFLFLCIAAYQDYRTEEIPLWIFPNLMIISTGIQLYKGFFDIKQALIGLFVFGLSFLLLALLSKGGGGDVIMMGALGWCLGLYPTLIITIISLTIYFFALLFLIIVKKKKAKKAYCPYAPFVLCGYIGYCIMLILNLIK